MVLTLRTPRLYSQVAGAPHARCDCPLTRFVPVSYLKGLALSHGNVAACPRCLCFVCSLPASEWCVKPAPSIFAIGLATGDGHGAPLLLLIATCFYEFVHFL